MKRSLTLIATALLCIVLCLFFGSTLLRYAIPMNDASYDLSLMWEGEGMPENWVYDQKGWRVFSQQGEQIIELTADGAGMFYGEIEPNQVFYYARELTEEVDQPTLRINAYSYSIAVFLDGELLYSDAYNDTACIGAIDLPELDWERTAPIILNLPRDYLGKTLTIAQNAGSNESQSEPFYVLPRPVTLYCGYAVESSLISESFTTAIPATLFFAAALTLLAFFAAGVYQGRWRWSVLLAALTLLLYMLGQLAGTSYFKVYLGAPHVDLAYLCRCFSLSALLVFLACRAKRLRIIPWAFAILNLLSSIACLVIDLLYDAYPSDSVVFLYNVPFQLTGFFGLIAISVCAWLLWRRQSRFYRRFAPLMTIGTFATMAIALILHSSQIPQQLYYALIYATPAYFLWPLMLVATISAVVTFIAELAEQWIAHRTEVRQMVDRIAMVMESYTQLRLQYEQVMMLRHDMAKHLHVLHSLTQSEAATAYLDDLIGENKKFPAILQSGNQVLDIILNGKLSLAKAAGADIRLLRVQAPQTLPLRDAEICSVMMNLMDNAVRAVSDPNLLEPFICLDMHISGHYFIFSCENSAAAKEEQKKTVPGHGLGLKIVRQILDRYESSMIEIERNPGSYKVTLGIYLGAASK